MSRLRGDRFSAVIAGRRGAGALTNFVKWIQEAERRALDPDPTRPTRSKLTTSPVYIKPFGLEMTATVFAKVSGTDVAIAALGAKAGVATRIKTGALAANSNAYTLGKFAPARFSFKTGMSQTGTTKTSHITKLKYKTKGGTSSSLPFGKAADSDSYAEAKTAITAGVMAAQPAATTAITFLPEVLG